MTADITSLATQYGRYGYRRITAMLRQRGWRVNAKRVARIWQREGLKVPAKQPKRGRLWLNDGSCIRLRPEYPNHVWSYDFVEDRTHDGRKYRMLNVIDEFTRECLAIRINRKLKSTDVIDVLSDLFIMRGIPTHVRSDNVLCQEKKAFLVIRSRGIRIDGYRLNNFPGGLRRQEVVSSIANTGSADEPPSPSLRRDPKSQAEGPNIIYEVA